MDPIILPVSVGDSIQLASNVIISLKTYIDRWGLAVWRRSTRRRGRSSRSATVRGGRRSGIITGNVDND